MTADPDADPRVLRSRLAGEGAEPPVESTPTEPVDVTRAAAAEHRLRVRDTLIEKIIREAQAAGQFENLPYRGERLPLENDAAAGEMAAAFRILRNAGAAPEWIETDKQIRRLLAERDVLLDRAGRAGPLMRDRYRAQLRSLVTDINRLVFALSHEAPTPRQHRQPLDLERDLADLEARFPA
jgi:hypothetical protein